MKIGIGTVQFGLPYGIANFGELVTVGAIRDVLNMASSAGILTLDTAIAYGDSEHNLGSVGVEKFEVITKLPSLPKDISSVDEFVINQVNQSLMRLKIDSLAGLLLHKPADLNTQFGANLYAALIDCKKRGLVRKIGVSIYSPLELPPIINRYELDIVQAPFNIIDQRLHSTGLLKQLQKLKIEIHARSVFLQGLLLMPSEAIPDRFKKWQSLFDQWYSWLHDCNMTPLQGAIAFTNQFPSINKIIVGVQNKQQLSSIIQAADSSAPISTPNISSTDEQLINPSNW